MVASRIDGYWQHISGERSRVRELLLLVPAIALITNVAAFHLITLQWYYQAGILLVAVIVSVHIVRRSPIFAISKMLQIELTLTYDANKDEFVSALSLEDLIGGAALESPWSLAATSSYHKLREAGVVDRPPTENLLSDGVGNISRDIGFFWILEGLSSDFRTSWAKPVQLPIGTGRRIQQESTEGSLFNVGRAATSAGFLEENPSFLPEALDLGDVEFFLPRGANVESIQTHEAGAHELLLRWGKTSAALVVSYSGGRTGLPPDRLKSHVRQEMTDEFLAKVMEEQKYFASVAQVNILIQFWFRIPPVEVLGRNFSSRRAWLEALTWSLKNRCRREAHYIEILPAPE